MADRRRAVFTWRRWEIYAVLAFVLVLFATFVLAPVWLNFKVRREADQFGTPAGMQHVNRPRLQSRTAGLGYLVPAE